MPTRWLSIRGYEGIYEVSDSGYVRTVKTGYTRKGNLKPTGYREVILYDVKHTRKYFKVHRLVAEAFIENLSNHPVINHKDEVKDNNHYLNLEWCTVSYNTLYSKHKYEKAFTLCNPLGIPVEVKGIRDFCKINNLDSSCVSRLLNGKQNTHKGWTRYE